MKSALVFRLFLVACILSSALSSEAARRRRVVSLERGDCTLHLTYGRPSESAFNFKVSQLEVLYLDIVATAWKLRPGAPFEQGLIEKFINLKVQFLNEAMPIVKILRADNRDQIQSGTTLRNVLEMIRSLGAPMRPFIEHAKARKYSSKKDDSGRATTIGFILQSETENVPENERMAIGFGDRSDILSEDPYVRRSIGFGTLVEVADENRPAREIGRIAFDFDYKTQTAIIHDQLNGQTYKVLGQVLNTLKAKIVGFNLEIIYDTDKDDWVVDYEEIEPKDKRIGF